MIKCPTEPNPGDRISATFMRDLVRYVRSLRPFAGPGINLSWGPNGTHYSSTATGIGRIAGTTDVRPFAVRYVETDSNAGIPYTGFEIYLPIGCVAVGTVSKPINVPATRTSNGSTVTVDDWYRMPYPSGSTPNGTKWLVSIHAKASAGLIGIDTFTEWPKNYLFAEIHPQVRTQEQIEDDYSAAGDDFSTVVGTVTWKTETPLGGSPRQVPDIRRTVSTPVSMALQKNREFELLFGLDVDESTLKLSLERLFVRNKSFSAAGTTFVGKTMTEIDPDDCEVWLKIDCETSGGYVGTVYGSEGSDNNSETIVDSNEDQTANSIVNVRLYSLVNGQVVTDNRESIKNIQIYHR